MSRLVAHLTTTPSMCNAPIIKKRTETKVNNRVPMLSPSTVVCPTSGMLTPFSVVPLRKLNVNERMLPSSTLEHAPSLNNIARSRICDRLSKEQMKKVKEFMENFGWKEIRNKDSREAAKEFRIENGIGKNQWKYWLEHPSRVRVRKGSPTK
ncbi:hypothetical protein M9H77_06704 [Catharanthus roseus]|uniref:Uncharacterized protein n=1 Tax=Catharanthus roseus TaxID=4058 RepID=A0ACC0BSU9_CATRO|nr:hypothetical protein M9H77_06704 [Catharanthus roseus]